MRKINKKGQMSLGDAPSIILIVGLVFLTLATVALIGQRYGDALDIDNTAFSATNETLTSVDEVGEYLVLNAQENALCSIGIVTNATDAVVINSGNYTQTNCKLAFKGATTGFNNTNWNVSYTGTYSLGTIASNTTDDLQSNVSENTGIAGIILTISLVGIVLTILIGVFVGIRRGSSRV